VNKLPAAQAVEQLAHEYGKLVFYTIYGMTNDWEESQDLTQETFVQALKAIDAAREASSGKVFHAKAWLLQIAINTVRMQRRRRALFRFIPFSRISEEYTSSGQRARERIQEGQRLEHALAEQSVPVQPAGYASQEQSDPAESLAEQDGVRRAMATLPETMRVPLLLSVVGGLSAPEIARLLEVNEATVRQRLARGRKQFQQAYTRESGEELVNQQNPVAETPASRANEQYMTARQRDTIEHDNARGPQRLTLFPHS
jgi:RNA polymerase sigma-70 factor (ECF subfamily)